MFNHILHALINFSFMKNGPENIKNSVKRPRTNFAQALPALLHKIDGDLDAVVGGLVEEEGEDLEGDHDSANVLVHQVGDEDGG
jgi:hypothetical protein